MNIMTKLSKRAFFGLFAGLSFGGASVAIGSSLEPPTLREAIGDGNLIQEKSLSEIKAKIAAIYDELRRTPYDSDKWTMLYSAKQALSWALADVKCPLKMTLDWTNADGSVKTVSSDGRSLKYI
jgi:hypothetical protein